MIYIYTYLYSGEVRGCGGDVRVGHTTGRPGPLGQVCWPGARSSAQKGSVAAADKLKSKWNISQLNAIENIILKDLHISSTADPIRLGQAFTHLQLTLKDFEPYVKKIFNRTPYSH